MLKRLRQNTLLLLVNNLTSAFLAFLLSILIGRSLGDVALGQYASVMAWIMPLTLLADAGMNTLITRDLAQAPQQTPLYLKLALYWRASLGAALIGAVWFIAPWLSADGAVIWGLRLTALMIWIDATFGVYTAIWRAQQTMLPIMLLNIGLLTTQVLGSALAIKLGGDIRAVFGVIVLADGLQLLATWGFWRYQQVGVRYAMPLPSSLPLTRYTFLKMALPFGLAGLLAALQLRLIFFLLQAFNTPDVLGWFAAASRFLEAAKMPAFAFFGAFFPALMGLSQQPEALYKTFKRSSWALGVYGLVMAGLLALSAPFLIHFAYGAEFAQAAPILTLLALSLPLLLLRQNLTTLYYARQQEGFINQALLVVLVLQALLGGILLRRSPEGQGAALTLLAGEGLLVLILWRGHLGGVLPLGVGLFSLALQVHLLAPLNFDGLYGQDAFAYFQYGESVKTALAEGKLPGPMYWGLGWPGLLGLVFSLVGTSAETAQALVMLLAAMSSALLYSLTYHLLLLADWPRREAQGAGLVAGLLLVGCGQFLQSSVVIMSDVPALFWALLSAWALVNYLSRLKENNSHSALSYWLLLAAGALAMAGITRWIYLILAFPWGGVLLVAWAFRPPWKPLLAALVVAGFILGLQALHTRQQPTPVTGHYLLAGWSWRSAWQQEFNTSEGHFQYPHTVGHFYSHPLADNFYLAHWLSPLLLAGLVVLLRQPRRHMMFILLLGGWFLGVYGFLIGIPYQNMRFALAFFPPVALLVAVGGVGIWHYTNRWPLLGRVWLGWAGLIVGVGLLTTYHNGQQATRQIAINQQADKAAVIWAAEMIPEAAAQVYSLGLWLTMQHYAPELEARQIYYETPQSLAQHDYQQPVYLLLNMWGIEHQWQGKPPWIAYHWLESEQGLIHLGRYGNYHLFRVKGSPS